MTSSDDLRERIDRLVDARFDGEIADADWQRHVLEIGPRLETALAHETSVRAGLRALPRAPAPDAVRAAILAHATRARAAGPEPIGASAASSNATSNATSNASPRIIRGGWWWSASALAAACLVVALSLDHQPAGTDRGAVAYGRERKDAPSASEHQSRQRSYDAPVAAGDERTLAILEQDKAHGQQPEGALGRADAFSEQAKELQAAKDDDARLRDATGNASTPADEDGLLAKTEALKRERELAPETRSAGAPRTSAQEKVADGLEAPGEIAVAKLETADAAAKDAKRSLRSRSAGLDRDAAGTTNADGGRRATDPEAVADDAPDAGRTGSSVAAANALHEEEQLAPAVAAKPAAAPAATAGGKSAAVDAPKRPAAPAEAAQAGAAPAPGQRVARTPPAAPTTAAVAAQAVPPDASVALGLSLDGARATITAENRSGEPLLVRRGTLVIEALDRSQRSCWMHATALPAADATIAAHQQRSWSLALVGTDAPPAESVQLRVRLQSRLSALQAWPTPTPPAASAAPAGAPAAASGP